MSTAFAHGSIITAANEDAWLAERKLGIGSSEAATVLGINPYETPLTLYCRKLGLAEKVVETEPMRWGKRLEPLIAEAYAERVGIGFGSTQLFLRRPEFPWQSATLDGVRADGLPVEFKTVNHRVEHQWGEEGSDEIPAHYLCQVHHQLAVTSRDRADVAALFSGSELRIYTVHRDEEIVEHLTRAEADFLDRLRNQSPPPPVNPHDIQHLSAIYKPTGIEVELDDEAIRLVDEYESIGEACKEAENTRQRLRLELIVLLGEASLGLLPDGRKVKRSVVEVKERTQLVKAHSQTRISISQPRNRE